MQKTLKSQKLNSIFTFLTTLQKLKHKTRNLILFSDNIQTLNASFKRLLNYCNLQPQNVEIIKSYNEKITKYSDPEDNIYVYVHYDLGVVKVDTGNERLNGHVFKLLKSMSVEDVIRGYYDHKTRSCDYCAAYDRNNEFPLLRVFEKDYVAAYHEVCLDELNAGLSSQNCFFFCN